MNGADSKSDYTENPDGSIRLKSGKILTKEEMEALAAKDRTDTRPALKKDVAPASDIMLRAVGEVMKRERRYTEECIETIRDQLKDLSGREVLTGGARLLVDGNATALSCSLEPCLDRRAVILDGEPPHWLQGLFK